METSHAVGASECICLVYITPNTLAKEEQLADTSH